MSYPSNWTIVWWVLWSLRYVLAAAFMMGVSLLFLAHTLHR